jgi:hypothetical protein
MNPLVLDLCAGTGAASEPLLEYGFQRLLLDPYCAVESTAQTRVVLSDVRSVPIESLGEPAVVWASPPCTEFSRCGLPWIRSTEAPDLSIVLACRRIIETLKPRVWCIENVRGSLPFLTPLLGSYRQVVSGRWFLWGNFSPLNVQIAYHEHNKEHLTSEARARRARIPSPLARAFARSSWRSLRQLELAL